MERTLSVRGLKFEEGKGGWRKRKRGRRRGEKRCRSIEELCISNSGDLDSSKCIFEAKYQLSTMRSVATCHVYLFPSQRLDTEHLFRPQPLPCLAVINKLGTQSNRIVIGYRGDFSLSLLSYYITQFFLFIKFK